MFEEANSISIFVYRLKKGAALGRAQSLTGQKTGQERHVVVGSTGNRKERSRENMPTNRSKRMVGSSGALPRCLCLKF